MEELTVNICKHYYMALSVYMTDVPTTHLRRIAKRTKTYDAIEERERILFRKAAKTCSVLSAKPREFITAQFHAFTTLSQSLRRTLLPQPNQLHTLGAQVRYFQYVQAKSDKLARLEASKDTQVPKFYRDERRLNGLVRVLRLLPADVLTSRPQEFSKEFLQARGVWPLVRRQFKKAQ